MKKLNFKSIILGVIIGIVITSCVFAESKTIQAFYNDIKIEINGKLIELKDAKGNKIEPFIYEGTTYLPVRAVAESLGMEVAYVETTNTVKLTTVTDAVYEEPSVPIVTPIPTPEPTPVVETPVVTPAPDSGVGSPVVERISETPDGIRVYSFENKNYIALGHIEDKYTRCKFDYLPKAQIYYGNLSKNGKIILNSIPLENIYGKTCVEYNYYIENIMALIK